jgi:hypothetical protein
MNAAAWKELGLRAEHQRLLQDSAISADVAKERGYYSVDQAWGLEQVGFGKGQKSVPTLVIPVHDVHGNVALHLSRPDNPRVSKDDKIVKYEMPLGARQVLDVHPRVRDHLGDPSVALFITEGARKVDSAISHGLCCVGVNGVWGWRGTNEKGGKTALPDFEAIALNGREVYLVFDSDLSTNEKVMMALERFGDFLRSRQAKVQILYLPSGQGGQKVGLDDFFAQGGTVERLLALTRVPQTVVPDEIELCQLLDEIVAFLRSYLILSTAQAHAIALWVAHTYVFDAVDLTPYLGITSAERRCGKSRLLELINSLVSKPLKAAGVTEAALFRVIEQRAPTLLIDEVDTIFGKAAANHEDLRRLLNAGFERGTPMLRTVGEGSKRSVEEFNVFCPKALAGIGDLPDTISDRTIHIEMKRRAPEESIKRYRRREAQQEAARLAASLQRWGEEAFEVLVDAQPDIPDDLFAVSDRYADCWEPLFAIADLAGDEWSLRSREAALRLLTSEVRDEESIGTRLLRDIKRVFDEKDVDRIATASLIEALAEDETAPWGEWNRGHSISPTQIARRLKPYGIRPRSIRVEDGSTPKGYHREQFEDAWRRYLSSDQPDETDNREPFAAIWEHYRNSRHQPPHATNGMEKEVATTSEPPHEEECGGNENAAIPDEQTDVAVCRLMTPNTEGVGEGNQEAGSMNGHRQIEDVVDPEERRLQLEAKILRIKKAGIPEVFALTRREREQLTALRNAG